MIDLQEIKEKRDNAILRAREKGIIIPTFEEMKHPDLISPKIKSQLANIGLWDVNPLNLFRITWKNEPKEQGGGYQKLPNYIEIPTEISGVKARILVMIGKWFPTGAHKVGAAFGCLVPRLVTGQFDPINQEAVWPSTGNYCRGGAFDSHLLGCQSIAILPEGMSEERFTWLSTVAGEVIKTPGSESNVKEIYDKCHELEAERGDKIVIFNQFEEFGNHLWHYEVTGNAIKEVLDHELRPNDTYFGSCFTTGSAGTIGAGDFPKDTYAGSKLAAGEALQCPTLYLNGYGAHRIEGIGDKHVPWIHNIRNTDMVIAIDDEDSINLIRLFNEPEGHKVLMEKGVPQATIDQLHLLGISSIANILMCIKMAKYYELDSNDVLVTVSTDSMDLYGSRLGELRNEFGEYSRESAILDYQRSLVSQSKDNVLELRYYDKLRIHNLKYFTWVEQQGKTVEELNNQWYQYKQYWSSIHNMVEAIDEKIHKFNYDVGLKEE